MTCFCMFCEMEFATINDLFAHVSDSHSAQITTDRTPYVSITKMNWLEKHGYKLVFCMFGCEPYIIKRGDTDYHFEKSCLGNPEVKNIV